MIPSRNSSSALAAQGRGRRDERAARDTWMAAMERCEANGTDAVLMHSYSLQITTGVCCATFPISSSACIMRFMRAYREWRVGWAVRIAMV